MEKSSLMNDILKMLNHISDQNVKLMARLEFGKLKRFRWCDSLWR